MSGGEISPDLSTGWSTGWSTPYMPGATAPAMHVAGTRVERADRVDRSDVPELLNAGVDWVVRAQDGDAAAVLAEVDAQLTLATSPRQRALALYARTLCLIAFEDLPGAIRDCRRLVGHCQDAELEAPGLRAMALLVDLLRRTGRLEEAIDQLARALALEPGLTDLQNPDVQAALGALAVALRRCGVAEESDRVERRLAAVEADLALPQRVSRLSNLAFDHVGQAMECARRAPFLIDDRLLCQGLAEIRRAHQLAVHGSYRVVSIEAEVLTGFFDATVGDAEAGLRALREGTDVLAMGHEGTTAKVFWIAGTTRALCRLDRHQEAVAVGRAAAARIGAGQWATDPSAGQSAERLMLSYELMRAEHPGVESPDSATAGYLALGGQRLDADQALLAALFRARVAILRGADERQQLAQAASVDALTGLVNRRGAAIAVNDAARRPAPEPVALLLIDLDGFKEVNDSLGHLAGDRVLGDVAGELRTAARLDDVVARWGGDEFVVIAVLDEERAVALADRLRERVRDCARRIGCPTITASIGVAIRERPVAEEFWLHRADEAMYAAKRSGGDATRAG